jgi:hypothetical protein
MQRKAQVFKRAETRSKAKPAKPKKKARVEKIRAGVGTARRNRSERAAKKALVMLEDSATTPSRKSTRKGKNRSRANQHLERQKLRDQRTPEARARKAQAKKISVRGKRD